MNTIISLAKSNPGALSFLMELNASYVPDQIKDKIKSSGIVGTDLYVLWSDLCEKDLALVSKLVENCPLEILKDACSRQDYSGRKLVAEYLN